MRVTWNFHFVRRTSREDPKEKPFLALRVLAANGESGFKYGSHGSLKGLIFLFQAEICFKWNNLTLQQYVSNELTLYVISFFQITHQQHIWPKYKSTPTHTIRISGAVTNAKIVVYQCREHFCIDDFFIKSVLQCIFKEGSFARFQRQPTFCMTRPT